MKKRVLVAPDKFKGCLTADEVCALMREVLEQERPDWEVKTIPLTDGGDGFGTILTRSAGGKLLTLALEGPDSQLTTVEYGLVERKNLPPAIFPIFSSAQIAVVEMAATSGLAMIPQKSRNPWRTHTTGLGELIAHLAESGVKDVLLGIGGSATQDLGLGALSQLGLSWHSRGENSPSLSPTSWESIEGFSWNPRFPNLRIHLACDVTNPLLGPRGTVMNFAEQKGLPSSDLPKLEAATEAVVRILERDLNLDPQLRDRPGAGAAGGVGYGFIALMGATLLEGATLFRQWFSLDQAVAEADLVISGEGKFDQGSLNGKGPGLVIQLAQEAHKTLWVFAGQVDFPNPPDGITLHPITPKKLPETDAIAQAAKLLQDALRKQLSA